MTRARSTDTGRLAPDRQEVARDGYLRAKFLRECAGLERGAEALRILAMASRHAARAATILRGAS